MQTTIRILGTILVSGRRMPGTAALGLLLVFGFAQPGLAQTATNPFSLLNNYFVTGDCVVGGVGLRCLGVNGFAIGTITIPDPSQRNSARVPNGADIVAASALATSDLPSLGESILRPLGKSGEFPPGKLVLPTVTGLVLLRPGSHDPGLKLAISAHWLMTCRC